MARLSPRRTRSSIAVALGNATSCSAVASSCASPQMAYERHKSPPLLWLQSLGHSGATDLNWDCSVDAQRKRGVENQHSQGLAYPSYDVQPRSARLGAHNAVRGVEDVPRRRRLVADCIL